ncbi:hypothetical protein EOD41_00755 [Mucilaginibacter limnophilus]|uniref:Uncharacterized protein n=1 Tax=Mucilaginibacter limnophilus TaxID=1932778 RepID=A0A437MXZ6_9SPHI|nr:hypothetical protein [Mucilaginibacter limnophilus]RVU02503.1 hypothetical protein EOD41_00755 [Mucilaginibacter limnophilus]
MLFKTPKRKVKRVALEPEKIVQKGFGNEMPPQKILVDIYFDQKGLPNEAAQFYAHFEKADWRSAKGTPYRNWNCWPASGYLTMSSKSSCAAGCVKTCVWLQVDFFNAASIIIQIDKFIILSSWQK